jgi:hypothetical protein
MNIPLNKLLVVVEVVVVALLGVPLVTLGIYRSYPAFEIWQTEKLGFVFPVFVDVVMVGVTLSMTWLHRRKPADYGLSFAPLRYHLDITAACFLPVVLASMPLGLGVDYKSWQGAFVLAGVQAGLLFALALIMRKKPSAPGMGLTAAGLFLMVPRMDPVGAPPGKVLAVFLTYALFVGFGEEVLYRGYAQSRLNEVFGRPYRFFGVPFGWGAPISAGVFGLSHAGILGIALGLTSQATLAWGFWTFIGGLVFSLVREKSGSVLTSALLHGLPQAIAATVMLCL